MRIGIHVRGFQAGKPVAVARALERGAETIQIFASNPRGWQVAEKDIDADRAFVRQMREQDVRPLFIHAPYLVNLASPSAEFRRRSMSALRWAMSRGFSLRASGVVVHAGSAGARRRGNVLRGVARAAQQILGEGRGPALILELTSGGIGSVASRLDQAAELLDSCHGHPRVRFCLDTCHLHAAGYDLRTEEGVGEVIEQTRAQVGWRRIALLHANDSRDPAGSRRDRHWHVGQGQIGEVGFRALLQSPALSRVPMICETPGELEEDRSNIARLKRYRDEAVR